MKPGHIQYPIQSPRPPPYPLPPLPHSPLMQEISKAIGGSWTDANEEDLLAELAVLEKEELGEATPAAAAAAAAPAPIRKPSKAAASVTVTEPTVTAVEPAQGAGQSLEELLPEAPTGPVTVSVRKQEEEEEEEGEKERPVLVPA